MLGAIGGAILGMGLNWGMNQLKQSQSEYYMGLQHDYDKKLMALQNEYNKQNAAYSLGLQKELWDYTNYENQVKHLKDAGLSVGLMYGQGGGGGATASANPMAGVSQGHSQAVGMGLQYQQMSNQNDLIKAEAIKTMAEAEKISGVDTEKTKQEIDKIIADTGLSVENTNVARSIVELNNSTTGLNKANTDKAKAEINKVWEEVTNLSLDNTIKEETKDAVIQYAYVNTNNAIYDGIQKICNIKLTEKQMRALENQIEGYWFELATSRMSAEAATKQAENTANRLVEEVKKWNKQISQEDEKILQQWIFGGINTAVGAVDKLTGALTPWGLVKNLSKARNTVGGFEYITTK